MPKTTGTSTLRTASFISTSTTGERIERPSFAFLNSDHLIRSVYLEDGFQELLNLHINSHLKV